MAPKCARPSAYVTSSLGDALRDAAKAAEDKRAKEGRPSVIKASWVKMALRS